MLVECPDCGRKVSDAAVNCPNCGRPIAPDVSALVTKQSEKNEEFKKKIEKTKDVVKGVGCIAVVIIVLILFFSFAGPEIKAKAIGSAIVGGVFSLIAWGCKNRMHDDSENGEEEKDQNSKNDNFK
ncbi:MAG: hypothetical protein MJ033_02170 [Victivallaceae bacterium]|nr:hypothetical protein [Victivallaceae bacterium]